MAQFIVVYDSCVLYPAPLRDLLMRLALTDLYHAKWTQEIHKEWMRNLLKNRPDLTAERLESVRARMDLHVRDSLKNPPKSSSEYLANLEKQSLPQTCAYLREYERLI